MTDIWEPWTPEVGQRVRISISPECKHHAEAMRPESRDAVQGQTGTVVPWGEHAWRRPFTDAQFPGHRYMVQVDRPCSDGKDKVVMAAAELEPLT